MSRRSFSLGSWCSTSSSGAPSLCGGGGRREGRGGKRKEGGEERMREGGEERGREGGRGRKRVKEEREGEEADINPTNWIREREGS